jgi:hypothetical protein
MSPVNRRALLTVCWCGVGVALWTSACRNGQPAGQTSEPRATATRDAATAGRPAQTPVTLTGCLQKGDGRAFILTEINSSQLSVGTSGSSPSTGTVEGEQVRAAAHAYRLQTDDDKALEALVGHQVRVYGTLTERADLPRGQVAPGAEPTNTNHPGSASAREDTGRSTASGNDRPTTKIEEGDLARIAVASIDRVADACGTARSTR